MNDERGRSPVPKRLEALAAIFWLSVAASVVPLLSAKYLPFTDLPEHVAVMSTLSRMLEAASGESATYQIAPWRSQYLLYHGAGALLTRALGDAVLANRLLLVGVAVALPLATRAALRALGRDEGLAILGIMPFLSRPLFIGFLPYVASLPLYLFGIALVVQRARGAHGRSRHAVLLALLSLALLYTHLSALVVFVATAVALDVIYGAKAVRGEPRLREWLVARVRSNAWLAPAGALAAAWSFASRITLSGDSLREPQEIGTMRLTRALHALPLWAFDIFQSHLDELCGAVWWSALAVTAVLGARAARPEDAARATPRESPGSRRPAVVRLIARLDPAYAPLFCVLALYLVTPFRVGAGGMLNVRLAPLVALTATLTVARSRGKLRSAALVLAGLFTVVHAANATWQIRAMDAEHMAGFDGILARMRPGTRLVTLAFDKDTRTHVDAYPFAGSYHRARGGGIASYSFSDLPHWPVQYRSAARPPSKAAPLWIYWPCEYRHAVDGPFYDYVLVSGDVEPFAAHPSGPAFREVHRSPGFVLYEKVAGEWWTGETTAFGPCGK